MESNTPARCHKLGAQGRADAVAQHGDCDLNGDLVDLLTHRLREAVGECVGITPEEHAAHVASEIARVRIARGARVNRWSLVFAALLVVVAYMVGRAIGGEVLP